MKLMQNVSVDNESRWNSTHVFLCLLLILSSVLYTGAQFFPVSYRISVKDISLLYILINFKFLIIQL